MADEANLAPRNLTQTERDALDVQKRTTSLIVFNTTTGKLNFWDGSSWVEIATV